MASSPETGAGADPTPTGAESMRALIAAARDRLTRAGGVELPLDWTSHGNQVRSDSQGHHHSQARVAGQPESGAGAGEYRPQLPKTAQELAALIDHTLLKPEATPQQVERLCAEAAEHRFASVCVNPIFVPDAARWLAGAPEVAVCTVVGFPLGAAPTELKATEARWAVEHGATELDMVIPVGLLKAGEYARLQQDVRAVVNVAREMSRPERPILVKVIIEAALLTGEEKVAASLLAAGAGAHYVKTSTGFGPGGATVEDVALMRATVGPGVGVKAAGGIRNLESALAMVRAGASRIGASAGVAIVQAWGPRTWGS